MALIIRIDVDRPYGKTPFLRHVLSRIASDFYFPKLEVFGYLAELCAILKMLTVCRARAYIFFRRCTLPSLPILKLIRSEGHEIGLHLENSRSFETYAEEKRVLEKHIGMPVIALSKHGSGDAKYGYNHYPPYEPDRYLEFARESGIKLFLGNLEDPSMVQSVDENGVRAFPSAFWLEPAWRDTAKYTIDWLLSKAILQDVVLLIHPENVLAVSTLVHDFNRLINSVESRVYE